MSTSRVALVTGSARGLGRAIAERLGGDGLRIVISDVDGDTAQQTAAELSAVCPGCLAIVCDVTDEDAVAALMRTIDAQYGRLDVVVNNAGILGLEAGQKPLVEAMSLDLWRRTLEVNLTGAFLVSRGAIPLMKRGGWGRIVGISSRAARMKTGLGNSNYAASKAGLIAFSRVLAGEVGRSGITVNCVAPSRIATEMTLALQNAKELYERNVAESAIGRLCMPMDVASAVSYLCSDQAGFLTGVVLDVNGGSFMA